MLRHVLFLAGYLLLGHAGLACAQTDVMTETIDQSLFHSEPVQEPDVAEKPARVEPADVPAVKSEPVIEYDTAVLQGLKKVTAETSVFEAPIDIPTRFGTLTITVKKCIKSKPEDQPENTVLILIQDTKVNESPATVFSGWMFSSSPAISSLEHPVYDITMLDCVTHKKPSGDSRPPLH